MIGSEILLLAIHRATQTYVLSIIVSFCHKRNLVLEPLSFYFGGENAEINKGAYHNHLRRLLCNFIAVSCCPSKEFLLRMISCVNLRKKLAYFLNFCNMDLSVLALPQLSSLLVSVFAVLKKSYPLKES